MSWVRGFGSFATFLVILMVIAPIFHEAGHTFMALLLGVPFNELKFGFHGVGPGVTVPEYVTQEFLVSFRYAGGMFAGAVLLVAYIAYSIWQRGTYAQAKWWSKYRWWLGYTLLASSAHNLVNGYFEGSHFEQYVTGLLPSQYHLLGVLLVPLLLHIAVTLLLKQRCSVMLVSYCDLRSR